MIWSRNAALSTFGLLAVMAVPAAVAVPGNALAAQVRRMVSVSSNMVKLSDLFSGLEPGQDCDIGGSPAPGSRVTIEQPQLAAIAAQFGVDWQQGAIPVRAVIERKGRSVTREELVSVIHSALVAAGAAEGSDISLSNYVSMMVPAEMAKQPNVESLSYDHASGHFTADLTFNAPGLEPMQMRVAGMAQEMAEVPVLTHNMIAGSIIGPDDLHIRRLGKNLLSDRTLLVAAGATGFALRHQMLAGKPISLDELSHPLLVVRGMSVILRLENTGLVLVAKGEAIDGGALGDRIHVLNPSSRAVLIAQVTGSGAVQVDPGSAPIMLTSQQAGLPSASSLNASVQASSQWGASQ